ncbi:MAG TPA: hypothetical protein VFO46_04675 [Candidatus Sulfotelmatobacter sp.]|nr:hypothetical protein [Candidatus Sulfotelmatobacter sp.]
MSRYGTDSRKIADKCLKAAVSSAAYVEIYENSLSTYTILGGLTDNGLRPRLNPARALTLRIPFLVGIGQASVAETELRRFVELILWAIYFTDHPVEWQQFIGKTGGGFSQDARKPISYAAHRELGSYVEYADELMQPEPSGLGVIAVDSIKQVVKQLNAAVHAGRLARKIGRVPPHDEMTEAALRDFSKIQRSTFSGCALLLAAYRRAKFDKLNAVSRAYFDWLIGAKLRRAVRKGPFGLP